MLRKTKTYRLGRSDEKTRKSTRVATLLLLAAVMIAAFYKMRTGFGSKNLDVQAVSAGITSTADQPHPLDSVSLPSGVESAIGTVDRGIIKTSESGKALPMASITKVITALVILEKAPLVPGETGDSIMLESKDEDYYWKYAALEGTLTPITAGYTMSQYDILQTMLLPSSNNMTDTLVDYYFESTGEFLVYANEYLDKNGMSNTRIVDATGFSPESVSTPSDLIKLGQLALDNPVVAEIVAKRNASVPVAGDIPNYNILIEEPNVTGIKPGFTEDAGSCLLYSADFSDTAGHIHTVIMVVMGAQDRSTFVTSTLSLLDQARSIYENPSD